MRAEGWEVRLDAVLSKWQDNQYDFATANCLLFARECIMAVRDEQHGDPLEAIGTTVERVTTPVGAARLLAKHNDAAAIITAVLGEPKPRLLARRGDLAAVPGADGPSIGAVDADVVHVLRHDAGMEWRPLSDAFAVWSVE